jgi:hypothetical protein
MILTTTPTGRYKGRLELICVEEECEPYILESGIAVPTVARGFMAHSFYTGQNYTRYTYKRLDSVIKTMFSFITKRNRNKVKIYLDGKKIKQQWVEVPDGE